MNNLVTLYKSLSPAQLAAVVSSGWTHFSLDGAEQLIFSPKLHREYAEMLARQIEAVCYSAGYVVSFQVPMTFLERYQRQTIGYQQHEEYRIPVSELNKLNRAIIGEIRLVSGFTKELDSAWQTSPFDYCIGYH